MPTLEEKVKINKSMTKIRITNSMKYKRQEKIKQNEHTHTYEQW